LIVQISLRLEVEAKCKLANAVAGAGAIVANTLLRFSEIYIAEVALRSIEVGMVEQVEEVREERELRTLRDLERFPQTEVQVHEMRSVDVISRHRAVAPEPAVYGGRAGGRNIGVRIQELDSSAPICVYVKPIEARS